jgi:hypothetical protein
VNTGQPRAGTTPHPDRVSGVRLPDPPAHWLLDREEAATMPNPAHPHTRGTHPTDLTALLADHNATGAALAATDADAFRQEGPRIDNRIGSLLSLILGALASSGLIGGVGASLSRAHHAPLAMGLLAGSSVVIATGLLLTVRLILPRLSTTITVQSGPLPRVAALPHPAAARAHYSTAARDCLTYQSAAAWSHAVAISRRFRRFHRAGTVLLIGVALATAGFIALAWGR